MTIRTYESIISGCDISGCDVYVCFPFMMKIALMVMYVSIDITMIVAMMDMYALY